MIRVVGLFLICFFINLSQAQSQAIEQEKEAPKKGAEKVNHGNGSVKKATLLSIIPGGGQIYNHSYWKVPVIYIGFGVLTYSFIFYDKAYNDVRAAYIQKVNNQPVTNPEFENVPEVMLFSIRESYKKSRDLSVVGMAAWYTFNLLDAAVDAHLKGFDVSDKLSLKIMPQYQMSYAGFYSGVSFKLSLK